MTNEYNIQHENSGILKLIVDKMATLVNNFEVAVKPDFNSISDYTNEMKNQLKNLSKFSLFKEVKQEETSGSNFITELEALKAEYNN